MTIVLVQSQGRTSPVLRNTSRQIILKVATNNVESHKRPKIGVLWNCQINERFQLLALSTSDVRRPRRITAKAGRVILAIDGLQPDVGHEVLWVIRDVLSGEVLLARSLLSSCQGDLAKLLREVKEALPVPIAGVVSDGQASIRNAVALALDGVPHQLCQFHYLREAALPVYEADRHAKVQLKKKVRAIRLIERGDSW